MSILGIHRPGDSWLHRAPVGRKLLGLAAFSCVVVVARGPWSGVASVVLAILLASACRVGFRPLWRLLRAMVLMLVLLGAFGWWSGGPARAVEVVCDLTALVLAATVVTVTTPLDELVDRVARLARPLRRVGLGPETVALAVSLMLRAIPDVMEIAHQTRAAAKARGLERSPRALLVPMVVRTVGRARSTGDALAARGIPDD